jgi:hypothetical protein
MAKRKNRVVGGSSPHEPGSELRANLLELVDACPVHQDNPHDCPLFPLRKMKPATRVQWFKALSRDDLDYLAAYHYACLNVRVESALSQQKREGPTKQ